MRYRPIAWIRVALMVLMVPALVSPALAGPSADRLALVLRVDEVIAVMRDEGLRYGETLDVDLLDGQGGPHFAAQVERIYDAGRMADTVRRALADGMGDDDIAHSLAFFDSERGQMLLSLETAARIAMADPAVEEIARANYADLRGGSDARLGAVARFVAVNDLLERNVAGALASDIEFYRGMVEGGAIRMSDAEITDEVWHQEPLMRADTESWLFGFLLMAYRPVSLPDLEAYSDFSATDAGQVLNAALFAGFDTVYRDISRAMGLAVARAMLASDI